MSSQCHCHSLIEPLGQRLDISEKINLYLDMTDITVSKPVLPVTCDPAAEAGTLGTCQANRRRIHSLFSASYA